MTVPAELPPGLEVYARSPEFTPETLPARLKSAHSTKAGTWGLLHVLAGSVRYTLEPPRAGEVIVATGGSAVIEPQVEHRVEFVEPGRFYVEFWRALKQPGRQGCGHIRQ